MLDCQFRSLSLFRHVDWMTISCSCSLLLLLPEVKLRRQVQVVNSSHACLLQVNTQEYIINSRVKSKLTGYTVAQTKAGKEEAIRKLHTNAVVSYVVWMDRRWRWSGGTRAVCGLVIRVCTGHLIIGQEPQSISSVRLPPQGMGRCPCAVQSPNHPLIFINNID